jgi:hypothetical protein
VNVEDAWCVDCGLNLGAFYPQGELQIFHSGGVWTAVTSLSVIPTIMPGDFIRGGNAILKVTGGAGQTFVCEMYAEPTNWIPETNESETFPIPQDSWT